MRHEKKYLQREVMLEEEEAANLAPAEVRLIAHDAGQCPLCGPVEPVEPEED